METLFKKHKMYISRTDTEKIRETVNRINWEKSPVAISGSKGVGKTTLVRQYIKKNFGDEAGDALYCMMDGIHFASHSLLDLAGRFHIMGGNNLFLDEIHRYPAWDKEIREIISLYPDLNVTFTGCGLSQVLKDNADLSRQVQIHSMEGLSFREFLRFYKGINLPVFTLPQILSYADDICEHVSTLCHPQVMFEEYLRHGYYPFYNGDETEYCSMVESIADNTIELGMTRFCGVEPAYSEKIRKILMYLTDNRPQKINIASLSSDMGLNKITVLSYLASMDKSKLIHLLYKENSSVTKMQKPARTCIHNPNLYLTLSEQNDMTAAMECFAVNQLSEGHEIEYINGHFRVDGDIYFDIEGEKKPGKRAAAGANTCILADRIEKPDGRRIPIWMVGLIN